MNENNAAIAYTGAFYIVPDTYKGAIDASTDLEAIGARNAGFLGESGISIESPTETEGTRVWQRNQEIRERVTEVSTTLGLELAEEDNEVTDELYHGSREVNGVLAVNPANLWSGRAVLDTWDFLPNGDVKGKRYVFPLARLSERGGSTLVSTDITLYPVTLTAKPDASGNTYYRHRLGDYTDPVVPGDEDEDENENPGETLAAPEITDVGEYNPGTAEFMYSAVPGATGYEAQYRINGGEWITVSSVPDSQYTSVETDAGNTVDFRVRAVKGSIKSEYAEASIITAELPGSENDNQAIADAIASALLNELQVGTVPEEELPKDEDGNLLNIGVEYRKSVSDELIYHSLDGEPLYLTTFTSFAGLYGSNPTEWDKVTVVLATAQDRDSFTEGYDNIEVNVTFEGGQTFTASQSR